MKQHKWVLPVIWKFCELDTSHNRYSIIQGPSFVYVANLLSGTQLVCLIIRLKNFLQSFKRTIPVVQWLFYLYVQAICYISRDKIKTVISQKDIYVGFLKGAVVHIKVTILSLGEPVIMQLAHLLMHCIQVQITNTFIYIREVNWNELFPITAPLKPLEHCTMPFLKKCDSNNSGDIDLNEWGLCLGLSQGITQIFIFL